MDSTKSSPELYPVQLEDGSDTLPAPGATIGAIVGQLKYTVGRAIGDEIRFVAQAFPGTTGAKANIFALDQGGALKPTGFEVERLPQVPGEKQRFRVAASKG